MGFRNNAYATVWDIDKKERYTRVRLSISRKKKDGIGYESDFSGWVGFAGEAAEPASKLKEKDRIQLTATDVRSLWDKENQKQNTWFWCYEFKIPEPYNKPQAIENIPPEVDEELPFA